MSGNIRIQSALEEHQQEYKEQYDAIYTLAYVFDLPVEIAQQLFIMYCAELPLSWRDCYVAIMSGNKRWTAFVDRYKETNKQV